MNANELMNLYDPITDTILCLKPLIVGLFTCLYFVSIYIVDFAGLFQSFNTKRKKIILHSRILLYVIMA